MSMSELEATPVCALPTSKQVEHVKFPVRPAQLKTGLRSGIGGQDGAACKSVRRRLFSADAMNRDELEDYFISMACKVRINVDVFEPTSASCVSTCSSE